MCLLDSSNTNAESLQGSLLFVAMMIVKFPTPRRDDVT